MHVIIRYLIIGFLLFTMACIGAYLITTSPNKGGMFQSRLDSYRYVMIEESQFERLVQALEAIAAKETK